MYTKDFHGLSLNEASYELDMAIKTARRDKDRILCLIVGHGASGKTHKIKTRFLELLEEMKKKNFIKDYLKGEDLNIFSSAYMNSKHRDRLRFLLDTKPNMGEIYVVL